MDYRNSNWINPYDRRIRLCAARLVESIQRNMVGKMTISELRNFANQGISLREVSLKTNIPIQTLYSRAKLFGIKFQHFTRQWQIKVEEEYEMPAKTVIMMFVRDKYSQRLAAGALGINRETLAAYCKKEGIKFPGKVDLRRECRANVKM